VTRIAHLRATKGSRGASAVEFALISVVFFPMLFGLIDYGLWFNDSLSARQGVREAARLGVVQNFNLAGCSQPTNVEQLRCITTKQVGSVSGSAKAKVVAPEGWTKRKPLIVCTAIESDGVIGLVPLPNDRIIASVTRMSIEIDDPVPSGATAAGRSESTGDADPSGESWTWCK
jgi:hypothetical protein